MRTKKNIKRKRIKTKKQIGGNPFSSLQKYLLIDRKFISENLNSENGKKIIVHAEIKNINQQEEIYLGTPNPEKRKITQNIKGFIDSNVRITVNNSGVKTTFVLRKKLKKPNSFFILKDYQTFEYMEFNNLEEFKNYLKLDDYSVSGEEVILLQNHKETNPGWNTRLNRNPRTPFYL